MYFYYMIFLIEKFCWKVWNWVLSCRITLRPRSNTPFARSFEINMVVKKMKWRGSKVKASQPWGGLSIKAGTQDPSRPTLGRVVHLGRYPNNKRLLLHREIFTSFLLVKRPACLTVYWKMYMFFYIIHSMLFEIHGIDNNNTWFLLSNSQCTLYIVGCSSKTKSSTPKDHSAHRAHADK